MTSFLPQSNRARQLWSSQDISQSSKEDGSLDGLLHESPFEPSTPKKRRWPLAVSLAANVILLIIIALLARQKTDPSLATYCRLRSQEVQLYYRLINWIQLRQIVSLNTIQPTLQPDSWLRQRIWGIQITKQTDYGKTFTNVGPQFDWHSNGYTDIKQSGTVSCQRKMLRGCLIRLCPWWARMTTLSSLRSFTSCTASTI